MLLYGATDDSYIFMQVIDSMTALHNGWAQFDAWPPFGLLTLSFCDLCHTGHNPHSGYRSLFQTLFIPNIMSIAPKRLVSYRYLQ
jgi:hypothetical protein